MSLDAETEAILFEDYFEQIDDLAMVLDSNGMAQWYNRRWSEILQLTDAQLTAGPILKHVHEYDRAHVRAAFLKFASAQHNEDSLTCRLLNSEQEPVWLRWHLTRLDDGLLGAQGFDISHVINANVELSMQREMLGTAAKLGQMGYWRLDKTGTRLSWSRQSYKMLGLTKESFDVKPSSVHKLYRPEDRARITQVVQRTLRTFEPGEYKTQISNADGKYIDVLTRCIAEFDENDGQPTGVFGISVDISEYEDALRAVSHAALHDSLTGLANRANFEDRLREALQHEDAQVAVILMDLDRFKDVNDTLGHPAGDQLLIQLADRLYQHLAPGDTVARLGGDEFVILQPNIERPMQAEALTARLLDTLSEGFDLDGNPVTIAASFGVAISPHDGSDPETLMRNADIALYRAKHDGRATCRFFEPEMDAQLRSRLALEHDLRAAIGNNEFELWYQPVFETGSKNPCSLEALIRWHSPSRGLVPPNDFIPLAEEKGLIVPIGNWVMRQACKDLSRWPADVRVAVNVSAIEFRNPNLVASICAAIYEFQVDPSRLELEITESALIADVEHTLATLHELRSLGLTIAMDDFGVGYSSLSYLRSFPFDKLKLDGSFVRQATTCADDLAIVRAVAGMAESLGMQTTAEGVETNAHLELIVDAGYGQVQGYLFSKPCTADDIEQAYFTRASALPTDDGS